MATVLIDFMLTWNKALDRPTTGDVNKRQPTKNWVPIIEDIINFLHFNGSKETQKIVYAYVPIPN